MTDQEFWQHCVLQLLRSERHQQAHIAEFADQLLQKFHQRHLTQWNGERNTPALFEKVSVGQQTWELHEALEAANRKIEAMQSTIVQLKAEISALNRSQNSDV